MCVCVCVCVCARARASELLVKNCVKDLTLLDVQLPRCLRTSADGQKTAGGRLGAANSPDANRRSAQGLQSPFL